MPKYTYPAIFEKEEDGEKHHVNFSQILQKGVKDYLHIP